MGTKLLSDAFPSASSRRKQIFSKEDDELDFPLQVCGPDEDLDKADQFGSNCFDDPDEWDNFFDLEEKNGGATVDEATEAEVLLTLEMIKAKHRNEFDNPLRTDRRIRGSRFGRVRRRNSDDSLSGSESDDADEDNNDRVILHKKCAYRKRIKFARSEEHSLVPHTKSEMPSPALRPTFHKVDSCDLMKKACPGFRVFARKFTDELFSHFVKSPLFDDFDGNLPRDLRTIYILRNLWLSLPENERQDWRTLYDRYCNNNSIDMIFRDGFDTNNCIEPLNSSSEHLYNRLWLLTIDAERLPCVLCSKQNPRRYSYLELFAHISLTHANVHLYACHFCLRAFPTIDLLKSHSGCAEFTEFVDTKAQSEEPLFFDCVYSSIICTECGLSMILSSRCDSETFSSSYLNCVLSHNSESFCGVLVYSYEELTKSNVVKINFLRLYADPAELKCDICDEMDEEEDGDKKIVEFKHLFELEKHLSIHHKKCMQPTKCPRCPAKFYNESVFIDHILTHVQELPSSVLFLHTAPICSAALEREPFIRIAQFNFQQTDLTNTCRKTFAAVKESSVPRDENHGPPVNALSEEKHVKDDRPRVRVKGESVVVRRSLRKRKPIDLPGIATNFTKPRRKQRRMIQLSKDIDPSLLTFKNYNEMLLNMAAGPMDIAMMKAFSDIKLEVVYNGRVIVENTVNGCLLSDNVYQCTQCFVIIIGNTPTIAHIKQCFKVKDYAEEDIDTDLEHVNLVFDKKNFPFSRVTCPLCNSRHCSILALRKHFALAHSTFVPFQKNSSTIQECAELLMKQEWLKNAFDQHLVEELQAAQKKEDASAASNDDDYLKSFMHILRMREKLMSMNSKGDQQKNRLLEKSLHEHVAERQSNAADGVIKQEVTEQSGNLVDGSAHVSGGDEISTNEKCFENNEASAVVRSESAASSHPSNTNQERTQETQDNTQEKPQEVQPMHLQRPVVSSGGALKRPGDMSYYYRDGLKCYRADCPFVAYTVKELETHEKMAHGSKKQYGIPRNTTIFLCRSCLKAYNKSVEYYTHMNSHASVIACKKCSAVSGNDIEFYEHRRHHTKSSVFACTRCSLMYTVEARFYLHMVEKHEMTLAFFCKTCGLCNTNPRHIFDHITDNPCRKMLTIEFIGYVDASQILFLPNSYIWLNNQLDSARLKLVEYTKCSHMRCLNARAEPMVSCNHCDCLTSFTDFRNKCGLSKSSKIALKLAPDNNAMNLMDILNAMVKIILGNAYTSRFEISPPPTPDRRLVFESDRLKQSQVSARTSSSKTKTEETDDKNENSTTESNNVSGDDGPPATATATISGGKELSLDGIRIKQEIVEEDDEPIVVAEKPPPAPSSTPPVSSMTSQKDNEKAKMPVKPPNGSMFSTAIKESTVNSMSAMAKSFTAKYLGATVKRETPRAVGSTTETIVPSANTASGSLMTPSATSSSSATSNTTTGSLESVSPPLKLLRLSSGSAEFSAAATQKRERMVAEDITQQDRPRVMIPHQRILAPPVRPKPRPVDLDVSARQERLKQLRRESFDLSKVKTEQPMPISAGASQQMTPSTTASVTPSSSGSVICRSSFSPLVSNRFIVRTHNRQSMPSTSGSLSTASTTPATSASASRSSGGGSGGGGGSTLQKKLGVPAPRAPPIATPAQPHRLRVNQLYHHQEPRKVQLDDLQMVAEKILLMSRTTKEAQYLCVTCDGIFRKQSEVVLHQFSDHGASGIRYALQCVICKEVFNSLTFFYAHIVSNPKHTSFCVRSKRCTLSFKTVEEARRHDSEHKMTEGMMSAACVVNCCVLCGTVKNYWMERCDQINTIIDHSAFHGLRTISVCRICNDFFHDDTNNQTALAHYISRHAMADYKEMELLERADGSALRNVDRTHYLCKLCHKTVVADMLYDHFTENHMYTMVEFDASADGTLLVTAERELKARFDGTSFANVR